MFLVNAWVRWSREILNGASMDRDVSIGVSLHGYTQKGTGTEGRKNLMVVSRVNMFL